MILRKPLLFVLVMILVLALLPVSINQSAQAQDDTITIGTTDLPESLDPAQADDFMTWEVLRHLYTGLTRQIPGTIDYELALATSHTVSDDGLEHTFAIAEDAQFADGTPITAETFAYSINRVLDLNYPAAIFLSDIGLEVTVSEDDELVLTTSRPIPYMEALVSLPMFFAVSEVDFPADSLNERPASLNSNGVYQLAGFEPGVQIQLTSNPDYAYGDPAQTANINLQNYAATDELRIAVDNGEVDLAWRDLNLTDAEELTSNNDDRQFVSVPSSRVWYILFNSKFDFVDDPVVRSSVLMTINRNAIVDRQFGGHLQATYSLVPSMLEDAYAPLWPGDSDHETAEQNLLDAGYRESRFNPPGFAIATSRPGYGDLYAGALTLVMSDLRSLRTLSINANSGADISTFIDALTAGDSQSAMFPWTPIVVHPEAYLYPLLHSDGPLASRNRISSEELDALLEEAAAANDSGLYQEAQEAVYRDAKIAPLWQDILYVVADSDITGITIEPNFFLHYDMLARQ